MSLVKGVVDVCTSEGWRKAVWHFSWGPLDFSLGTPLNCFSIKLFFNSFFVFFHQTVFNSFFCVESFTLPVARMPECVQSRKLLLFKLRKHTCALSKGRWAFARCIVTCVPPCSLSRLLPGGTDWGSTCGQRALAKPIARNLCKILFLFCVNGSSLWRAENKNRHKTGRRAPKNRLRHVCPSFLNRKLSALLFFLWRHSAHSSSAPTGLVLSLLGLRCFLHSASCF